MLVTTFSPFSPIMFSKGSFFRVLKSLDCVVKIKNKFVSLLMGQKKLGNSCMDDNLTTVISWKASRK